MPERTLPGAAAAAPGRVPSALRGSKRYLGIYGAAVARGSRAVLLTGAGGVGKTTLALELAGRGYRVLGDETVLYDRFERCLLAQEEPLMIRAGSFAQLSDVRMERRCAQAGTVMTTPSCTLYRVDARTLFGPAGVAERASAAAIVHVERGAATRLSRVSTARMLCTRSRCFYIPPGAASAMEVLQIFARVPAFELSMGALSEAADAVSELLERAC